MKKIFAILLAFCFLTSFSSNTKPPPTIINDQFNSPFDYTLTNPCNGEEVTVTGTDYISMHGIINNNRTTFNFHVNSHATGIGNMGNTYRVNSSFIAPSSGSLVNGQLRSSFSSTSLYISTGGAPNFKYSLSYQTTVNANGTTTVERFGGNIFDAVCLGN